MSRLLVGLLVIGVMMPCAAQSQTPAVALPEFEVASVKLTPRDSTSDMFISAPGTGRFTATYVSLRVLIEMAFEVDEKQISGGPNWLSTERYDITAKPHGDVGLSYEQLKP